MLSLLIPLVSAHTITVPTNTYFGIPSYGTYINFNREYVFDEVYRENDVWYFKGGTTTSHAFFKITKGNITVENFYENKILRLRLRGDAGTSGEIEFGSAEFMEPSEVRIDGGKATKGSDWFYTWQTYEVKIPITYSSDVVIEAIYIKGGGGVWEPPYIPPKPGFDDVISRNIYGMVFIIVFVLVLFYIQTGGRRKGVRKIPKPSSKTPLPLILTFLFIAGIIYFALIQPAEFQLPTAPMINILIVFLVLVILLYFWVTKTKAIKRGLRKLK